MIIDNNQAAKKFIQNKIHHFCIKNGGKILILFIYAIAVFGNGNINIERIHYVVLFIIVEFSLIILLLGNFIYEIEIVYVASEMTFKFYRGKDKISEKVLISVLRNILATYYFMWYRRG